ncbi:MAG: restriction endonuclease subunit S [Nitrospirae bacterium]|nr:restriction endonuclease subunit S [Nitrospirota bacterium]
MERYAKYKPSGVEWIGEMPEHWESLRIKRLTNVKRGASPRPIDDPKYFDDNGEFAWVRIADVTASDRYLESTTQRLSELGSSHSVKRNPGDFFLSIAGTVGKPIITKIKCCIHDGFVWFPNLKANAEYLYYIFSTGLPYQGLGKWGTQLNLNTDTVGEIFIPLPQNGETDKIVTYLDEKTAQIDTLIANKQKLIELLKEERTAIINQAVTKGINPKVKLKPSGIDWLGDIPRHWEVKKLKYVGESIIGITYNPNEISSEGEGILVLRASNIQEGYLSFDDCVYVKKDIQYKHFTRTGDIVLCARSGSANLVGKNPYIDEKCSGLTFGAFMTVFRSTYGKYLYYFFNSSIFKSQTGLFTTSTINQLTSDTLNNLMITFPNDVNEQNAIIDRVETETQKIDSTISKIEKEVELLQEYRTALISEVVTGKVKVT